MCAWTYSGNPNSSSIDEVHYRLGDTNPSNPIATDEECAFALREHRGNTYLSAASLAESKAYELMSRPVEMRRSDRSTRYMDPAQAFLTLAKQLRQNASIASATVYAGGQSISEKDSDRGDRDLVQPFARANLHIPKPVPGVESWEREP